MFNLKFHDLPYCVGFVVDDMQLDIYRMVYIHMDIFFCMLIFFRTHAAENIYQYVDVR